MTDTALAAALAQGESAQTLAKIKSATDKFYSSFSQMVVLEVISDPKQITPEKVDYWTKVLKIGLSWSSRYLSAPPLEQEKNYPRVFPRNTIIAQKKYDGTTNLTPPCLLLPFFPSHLSLPCKPGELIWALYENPAATGDKIGYWMCSVVQPYFIEDVNHTHAPMALRQSAIPKTAPEDLQIPYQLRNGAIVLANKDGKFLDEKGNTRIIGDKLTKFLADDDLTIFERLATETDAAVLSPLEVVPRFHKRPGDVVLEGSNNTLIVLGTDRVGPLAEFTKDNKKPETKVPGASISRGNIPSWPQTDLNQYAGSIDLVAGRGYTEETSGDSVDITQILNPKVALASALDKLNPVPHEGNPDFINDRSRILISQKTRVDTNFKLSEYLEKQNSIFDETQGDAAIVIKSDKIRLVARSDISLIVTNWSEDNNENTGEVYKSDSTKLDEWASITIKRDGNIVFTPSKLGVIKLGGDDADKAILCTDNLGEGSAAKPVVKDGTVIFKPGIISTGADLIGTGAAKQGTFATKILVK